MFCPLPTCFRRTKTKEWHTLLHETLVYYRFLLSFLMYILKKTVSCSILPVVVAAAVVVVDAVVVIVVVVVVAPVVAVVIVIDAAAVSCFLQPCSFAGPSLCEKLACENDASFGVNECLRCMSAVPCVRLRLSLWHHQGIISRTGSYVTLTFHQQRKKINFSHCGHFFHSQADDVCIDAAAIFW